MRTIMKIKLHCNIVLLRPLNVMLALAQTIVGPVELPVIPTSAI